MLQEIRNLQCQLYGRNNKSLPDWTIRPDIAELLICHPIVAPCDPVTYDCSYFLNLLNVILPSTLLISKSTRIPLKYLRSFFVNCSLTEWGMSCFLSFLIFFIIISYSLTSILSNILFIYNKLWLYINLNYKNLLCKNSFDARVSVSNVGIFLNISITENKCITVIKNCFYMIFLAISCWDFSIWMR